jgi:hypothetical protein
MCGGQWVAAHAVRRLSNCPSERWRVRVGMLESRVPGSMAECLVPAGSPNSVLHPRSRSHSKDEMPRRRRHGAQSTRTHMESLGTRSLFISACANQAAYMHPIMFACGFAFYTKDSPLDVGRREPSQEQRVFLPAAAEISERFRQRYWSIKASRLIRMRRFRVLADDI